jgi:hypothetical protein
MLLRSELLAIWGKKGSEEAGQRHCPMAVQRRQYSGGSAVQCSAVLCSAVQCSAVQCSGGGNFIVI